MKTKGINVLSLFDGISCGQLALQRAGIKVNKYFASEIDKYAIQVTQHNFPDTIQLGDVTKVKAQGLPKIDLIIGGSPCQGFSFAGKGLNFEDERSKLFFEFVRLVKECNPKYFLLENVKMKKEYELVISQYMKVAPIEINSALVSAQNRVRLYWTNINEKPYGFFGELKADIPQPKDKGMVLKDILQTEVDKRYFITEKALQRILRTGWSHPKFNPEKTGAILPKNNSGQLSVDSGTTLIINVNGKIKKNQNKASCFTAGGHSGGYNSDMDLIREVRQLNPNTESGGVQPFQQNRIYDADGISPALMAEMSSRTHAIAIKHQQDIIQDANAAAKPLVAGTHGNAQHHTKTFIDGRIRRLTEIECERLQTVPDNYTNHVSSTQRYRMLGNGWTVDVIAHIFSFL